MPCVDDPARQRSIERIPQHVVGGSDRAGSASCGCVPSASSPTRLSSIDAADVVDRTSTSPVRSPVAGSIGRVVHRELVVLRLDTCSDGTTDCLTGPTSSSNVEVADALGVVDEVVVGQVVRAGGSRPTTRASASRRCQWSRCASSQRACVVVRARRRVVRYAGRDLRRELGDGLLAFGDLLGRLAVATAPAAGSGRTRASGSTRCASSQSRSASVDTQSSVLYASISSSVGLVVRLEVLLVGDDAAAGVHHLAGRALHVELLDLLERVRLGRRGARPGARRRRGRRTRSPRSSSSTSVSRVPCAPMSRLIVVGSYVRVVVDVHVRVLAPAGFDHEVDELLERDASPRRGRAPRTRGTAARRRRRARRRRTGTRARLSSAYGSPSMSKKRSPGDGAGSAAQPALRPGARRRRAGSGGSSS